MDLRQLEQTDVGSERRRVLFTALVFAAVAILALASFAMAPMAEAAGRGGVAAAVAGDATPTGEDAACVGGGSKGDGCPLRVAGVGTAAALGAGDAGRIAGDTALPCTGLGGGEGDIAGHLGDLAARAFAHT